VKWKSSYWRRMKRLNPGERAMQVSGGGTPWLVRNPQKFTNRKRGTSRGGPKTYRGIGQAYMRRKVERGWREAREREGKMLGKYGERFIANETDMPLWRLEKTGTGKVTQSMENRQIMVGVNRLRNLDKKARIEGAIGFHTGGTIWLGRFYDSGMDAEKKKRLVDWGKSSDRSLDKDLQSIGEKGRKQSMELHEGTAGIFT